MQTKLKLIEKIAPNNPKLGLRVRHSAEHLGEAGVFTLPPHIFCTS